MSKNSLNLLLVGFISGVSGCNILLEFSLQWLFTGTVLFYLLIVLRKGRLVLIAGFFLGVMWFLSGFSLAELGGSGLFEWFYNLLNPGREYLLDKIYGLFWTPDAGLIAGVLLGDRANLDKQLLENFKVVGLTHILAVSGFNITLLINVMLAALVFLPRQQRFLAAWISILFFVVITGGSASVVRAGLMGSLFLLAKKMQRIAKPLIVLNWTAVLLLIWNPTIFNSDLSFVLSYLATLSLLLVMPAWEQIELSGWKGSLWDSMKVTLAAQMLTTPISIFYFKGFSLIAPFANLLILPFVPMLMMIGFLGVIGFILLDLLKVVGLPVVFLELPLFLLSTICHELVELMQTLVEWQVQVPFAYLPIAPFSPIFFVLYWFFLLRFFHKSKSFHDLY